MLTWIIYQAQHSDTDLVVERLKEPKNLSNVIVPYWLIWEIQFS